MQSKKLTTSQVSLHYINTMMSMRGVMEVQTTTSSQESLVSAVDIGTFWAEIFSDIAKKTSRRGDILPGEPWSQNWISRGGEKESPDRRWILIVTSEPTQHSENTFGKLGEILLQK